MTSILLFILTNLNHKGNKLSLLSVFIESHLFYSFYKKANLESKITELFVLFFSNQIYSIICGDEF